MADDKSTPPIPDTTPAPIDLTPSYGDTGGLVRPATIPTMSAAPAPGPVERVWSAIKEGIPAFNDKFEAASHTDTGKLASGETPKMQLVTPEAAMTESEKKAHPIATGIAETVGGLTSPENVAILAGTGGFGELPGAAGALIPKLISLGFSAQSLKGAYDQIPAFKKAMDAGDASEAQRIITHIVLDTAMGVAAGAHATEGAKAEVENAGVPDEASTLKIPKADAAEKSAEGDNTVPDHITFNKLGGKELRGPDSFGRTGGPFGRAVDVAHQVMREHGISGPEDAEPKGSVESPEIQTEGPEWDRTHSAVVDGKKVGSIGYHLDPEGEAQMYGAVVSPEMRGKGIGQQLLRSVIDDARDAGASRLTSDSTNNTPDILRVWEKLREKGLPIEPITHANGKPGYQIDFDHPPEPPSDKLAPVPEAQHEDTLARRGQLPGQSVNFSDAYGDTGKYVGGHVEYRPPSFAGTALGMTRDEAHAEYTKNLGTTTGPDLMDIPDDRLPQGSTTHDVITHELAHAVVGDLVGLPTDGMEVQSHMHPEMNNNAAAAALTMDFSKLPGVTKARNGQFKFTDEALADAWPKFLPQYLAGGVAQELAHGIPLGENQGMAGDLAGLRRVGKMLGFGDDEIENMIDAGISQTHAMLNHPATLDIIKNAAGVREEGLPKTLHVSADKVQDVLRQVREARGNENDTEGNGEPAGAVVSKAEPGKAGSNAEKNVRNDNGKTVSASLEASRKVKQSPSNEIMWHGTPSGDLRGGTTGLHVGTRTAATQALEARIGMRADGKPWDGTQEYGKTLLAGRKTLARLHPDGLRATGYNASLPEEDHYPTGEAKYSDETPVAKTAKPNVMPVKITGPMTNTNTSPIRDSAANTRMSRQLKEGSAQKGVYYKNIGEDDGSVSAALPGPSHVEQMDNTQQLPSTPPDAVGIHEDDLPRSAKYQDVDFSARDLQDSGTKVNEASIRKDYVAKNQNPSIYKSYIPMEEMPSAKFASESEVDDGDNFDRSDYHNPRVGVPVKVQILPDGKMEIVDGNHRTRVWEDQNQEYAPAWVIDYRHSDIEHLSEDEKAERAEEDNSAVPSKLENRKPAEPIRAYHGTAAATDFKDFSTEGRQVDEKTGEPLTSGSGADPTSYLGAHFAAEPETANKFATRSMSWMQSRFEAGEGEEGAAGPRVIPVDLKFKRPMDFGTESNMRKTIYSGDLSKAGYAGDEVMNAAMQADGIEDDPEFESPEAVAWMDKYKNDLDFRVKQNEWAFEHFRPEEGQDDLLHEAAAELAGQARNELQQAGYDGAVYKNEVEGGKSYVAFHPTSISSPFKAEMPKVVFGDPDDFASAVQNTPGAKLDGKEIQIHAERFQKPEQAGEPSIRTGVFYSPEINSPYSRYYKGKMGYGGSQRVEGDLTFKNPIVAKGASGGKVPERAYDAIKGKGAYQAMRDDVLKATQSSYWGTKNQTVAGVRDVLEKYGSDPDTAEYIMEHSTQGNTLPYAIQENIVAHAVRDAGHDGIVGYNKIKGQHRLSEVFHITQGNYPEALGLIALVSGYAMLNDQDKEKAASRK